MRVLLDGWFNNVEENHKWKITKPNVMKLKMVVIKVNKHLHSKKIFNIVKYKATDQSGTRVAKSIEDVSSAHCRSVSFAACPLLALLQRISLCQFRRQTDRSVNHQVRTTRIGSQSFPENLLTLNRWGGLCASVRVCLCIFALVLMGCDYPWSKGGD